MSGDTLAWFGIVVSVLLAALAVFFAPKLWRNVQKQKIDRGSTGYQAGNDINIDKKP